MRRGGVAGVSPAEGVGGNERARRTNWSRGGDFPQHI